MLSRRSLLAAIVGLLRAASKPRPHIVLFLADDHGYFDSPVYGARDVRTPNLETLAKEGLVFTNAFTASPTCVPSRSVIMSGLYPARNGALPNHSGLTPGVKTLPTYLKQSGYRVAHFGKSHFQPRANYPDMEFVPSEVKGEGPLNSDLDPPALARWLANVDPVKQPLCLIVCSHSPHVYWQSRDGYDPDSVTLPPTFVDTPETREYRAQYYADITKADRQLGEVREICRRLGDNTLFLYTSDNGAQWPFAKWGLYDAGIRLPFVAAWPGVIKARSRTDAMISFVDLLPTLVQLAGGLAPNAMDGRSFAAVLTGGKSEREEIFAAHSGDGDWNVYPMRAVRTTRWKYIRNLHPEFEYTTHIDRARPADGKFYFDSWVRKSETDPRAAAIVKRYHERPAEELYDVARDPHEQRNLAADARNAATLRRLRNRVTAWMAQQQDEGKVFGKPRPLVHNNGGA